MPPETSPDQILAMSRAFMASRILLTGAELDLFSLLASEPLTAEEAAEKTGYHLRPLAAILDALAALGLLEKKDDRYGTDPETAAWLSSDSPTSILPMVLHAGTIWHNWSNLTRIASETGVTERTPIIFRDPEEIRSFIGAMHVVGARLAPEIVAALAPLNSRKALDVGGASGAYTLALLEADPELTVTLFDRPEVIEMARDRIGRAGRLDRVRLVGGDFYQDDLPQGHDLALLSAIIHQNSPEQNLDLFRKVFSALDPGGRIIIRDHVMSDDRTSPKSGALFAINMLVGTPGGGTYTLAEIEAGLTEAGFQQVRLLKTGEKMDGLVEARKP